MEWWWKSVCIGAFVATAAFAQPQPEIRVRVWCGANYQDTHHWAGDPIDINVGEWVGCPDHVNIWDRSGSPTHDIGPVYLYGSRASPITITISSGAWRGLDNTRHAAATSGSWAGITVANGMDDLVYLEGRVGGDLTGLVRVGEIYRPPMIVDIGQGFGSESRLFIPDPARPSDTNSLVERGPVPFPAASP